MGMEGTAAKVTHWGPVAQTDFSILVAGRQVERYTRLAIDIPRREEISPHDSPR
jgi:hypothetical protein